MTWGWQLEHGSDKPFPGVKPYENEGLLVDDVKKAVEEGKAKAGRLPRVLVIGALGRCGRGAVDLCVKAGLQDILVRATYTPPTTDLILTTISTTEMGPPRNLRKTRPLPRDHRVRRLRQLHLPLRQDPAFH